MQRWYRKGCTSCVYSLSILYHWRLPGPTARFEDVRLAVHSISIPRTVAHEMAVIFSFFCLTVRIANFYRIESECQNLNATNKYWSHNFSFHQTNTSLPCIHIQIIKRQRSSYQQGISPIYLPFHLTIQQVSSYHILFVLGFTIYYCWTGFGLTGVQYASCIDQSSMLNDTCSWQ